MCFGRVYIGFILMVLYRVVERFGSLDKTKNNLSSCKLRLVGKKLTLGTYFRGFVCGKTKELVASLLFACYLVNLR